MSKFIFVTNFQIIQNFYRMFKMDKIHQDFLFPNLSLPAHPILLASWRRHGPIFLLGVTGGWVGGNCSGGPGMGVADPWPHGHLNPCALLGPGGLGTSFGAPFMILSGFDLGSRVNLANVRALGGQDTLPYVSYSLSIIWRKNPRLDTNISVPKIVWTLL